VQKYLRSLNRHRGAAAFLSLVVGTLVLDGIRRGVAGRTALYLTTIGLAALAVDLVAPRRDAPLPVRTPGTDLLQVILNSAVAFAFLWIHFVAGVQPSAAGWSPLFFVLGLGALFNVFLFILFLARGYSPADLGVRVRGLASALLVIAIFATAALFRAHGQLSGVIVDVSAVEPLAGLSEEFFRLLWQTRLGAATRNPLFGWIAASCLWAAFHVPVFWIGSHSFLHASIGCLQGLPLGLLWGYMTHRTRSFLPAALVHGTNFWGLNTLG
jgi:hypothetical protein